MATGNKADARGGRRAGAGRPKETLSVRQVNAMLRAARKRARREKRTIDEILLDIIYEKDAAARDVLPAIKLWKHYTIAKLAEGGETDKKADGPAVYLPEQRPSLEVIDGGK